MEDILDVHTWIIRGIHIIIIMKPSMILHGIDEIFKGISFLHITTYFKFNDDFYYTKILVCYKHLFIG